MDCRIRNHETRDVCVRGRIGDQVKSSEIHAMRMASPKLRVRSSAFTYNGTAARIIPGILD
jgi:hypothetical protein